MVDTIFAPIAAYSTVALVIGAGCIYWASSWQAQEQEQEPSHTVTDTVWQKESGDENGWPGAWHSFQKITGHSFQKITVQEPEQGVEMASREDSDLVSLH